MLTSEEVKESLELRKKRIAELRDAVVIDLDCIEAFQKASEDDDGNESTADRLTRKIMLALQVTFPGINLVETRNYLRGIPLTDIAEVLVDASGGNDGGSKKRSH